MQHPQHAHSGHYIEEVVLHFLELDACVQKGLLLTADQ